MMTEKVFIAYQALRKRARDHAVILVDTPEALTDAVESAGVTLVRNIGKLELGPAQLIHNALGHIPANPSKSMNTRLLSDSYVYASHSPPFVDGDEVINRNPRSGETFVDRLILAARNERERLCAEDDHRSGTDDIDTIARANSTNERFFVVRGSRGVGKTYFLNHVLSSYSEKLDRERVVWIRLNLPISRNFDHNIEQWIDAQIVKILLRYYDPKSTHYDKAKSISLNVYDYIKLSIDNLGDEFDKISLLEKLDYLSSMLMKAGEEEDISPENTPLKICSICREFCHRERLGLIIVFDGFDRLDYDVHSSERFLTLRDQLRKYSTSGANSGRIYVCVTRTYTFNDSRQTNPFARSRRGAVFTVEPVGVREILRQRIDAIRRWLGTGMKGKSSDRVDALGSIIDDFERYLDGDDVDWKVDELERILSQNNRAKTQAVQFMFVEFLSERSGVHRYKYKLVEFLTTAGRNYPPVFYKYFATASELKSEIAETLDYDSRFLPIIFRQMIPQYQRGQARAHEALLAIAQRLRILQLLYFDWAQDRQYAESAPMEIDQICEILNCYFGYRPDLTRALIAELEVFELCLIRRNGSLDEMSGYNGVKLLPKGRYLLDEFVYDIAYLNLNAMRVLFTRSTFISGIVRVSQRPINLPVNDRVRGIRDWVMAKLINSAVVLGVLDAVNDMQKKSIAAMSADDRRSEVYDEIIHRMLRQIDDWNYRVKAELASITKSMVELDIINEKDMEDQIYSSCDSVGDS